MLELTDISVKENEPINSNIKENEQKLINNNVDKTYSMVGGWEGGTINWSCINFQKKKRSTIKKNKFYYLI